MGGCVADYLGSLEQKSRGAFFTPPSIAAFLASWAIADRPDATVLDPTCGEAVFLLYAGQSLMALGRSPQQVASQVYGVDLHAESLERAEATLREAGVSATLLHKDVFAIPAPDQLGCPLPLMDAVIGNPPFVRYQDHKGTARAVAAGAAMKQGVRLSGLASSWAAALVHSCAFLKPEGRVAIVLPAELLAVHYAEPVRRWLRRRFAAVSLVMFERLQFEDALEKVVLLLARGEGGCDAFSIYFVQDAGELAAIKPFDEYAVTPTDEGKWTDLLLPLGQRRLFRSVCDEHFCDLHTYGRPVLGTVTGANDFFMLNETTRLAHQISEREVVSVSPPGTRHLRGTSFTQADWLALKESDERVWLLHPSLDAADPGLARYLREGEAQGVHEAYKCRMRDPWWRPPLVPAPDLFFTYMSHRFPRLIANEAHVHFVNSMHGIHLPKDTPAWVRDALPLLALNSVSMLGAEVRGRSYGGGILKMEPREASRLPVPKIEALSKAWRVLGKERVDLERQLRSGLWTVVLARVDEVLLRDTLGLAGHEVAQVHAACRALRERRIGPAMTTDDG
jgi:tRNA1(Val) A37 N6-methylase TrmN6